MTGVKAGRFKDGSALVFDLLEFVTKNKAPTEGVRVLLGVMVKDSKPYPETGGWGFEAFKCNSRGQRLVTDGGRSCFECHASQKDHGYVFSHWRE